MDAQRRLELVSRLPTEEVVTNEELLALFESKRHPVAYDGFEPSGTAHIASGLMRAQKIGDMLEAGVRFKLFVADWHAWLNSKMGGDLDRIQQAGEYLVKVWESLGLDTSKVEIHWASEHVESAEYWKKVAQISMETTVSRMNRCAQIMGRSGGEMQRVSQYLYPAMQCADIFQLEADITALGMDQRKVNMLAREVGPKIGYWKPAVVSHHMLIGLQGPQKMEMDLKMSKSKPNTAIFMHDTKEQIFEKLQKAYCQPREVADNPLLELCRYVIFRGAEREFTISRPAKFGGGVSFTRYGELELAYSEGKVHPMDLKSAVAAEIDRMIGPCRSYFEKHPKYLEVFNG